MFRRFTTWSSLQHEYKPLIVYGIIAGLTVFAALSAFTGVGGWETPISLFFLVIMLSALFIHRRFAYGAAIICSLIVLGLLYANRSGLVSNAPHLPIDTASWLIQIAWFFIVAGILDGALRQVDRALERAKQALEERYRLITSVSSDYTFSTEADDQGNLTHNWVAGAFESIMGYTFEEYQARGGWLSVLHPDDIAQDAKDMEGLRGNQPVTTEVRIVTKTNEIRWIRVYGYPVWNDAQNCLAGIYGAVQDITTQKQAEAALREAELRYRTLVEQTSVVIYRDLPDADSTALYISPQIETLLGYTPEEWTGNPILWQSLLHPDDQIPILAAVEHYFSRGEDFTSEYRMQARDGRWVWVRDEAVVVADTDGKPLFVQGVLMDITEQKQAEERKQELMNGLRAVVEITDELIRPSDFDSFCRRAVELAREKLGLERCSLFLFDPSLTYQLGTFGTTDDGLTSDERFLKLELKSEVANKLLYEGERSVLIIEGKHVAWDSVDQSRVVGQGWIATTLIRSASQPIGVFSNDAAITNSPMNEIQQEILLIYCSLLGNIIERRRAEEALRNNEKRFRALVEQLPAITYSDDIAQLGRTIYISPQVETILGYTPQAWLTGELDFWLAHIHPDDRSRALTEFEACFQHGIPVNSEYRMFTKSGKEVWIQDQAVRLDDETGQPTLIQGVMTDITEQKQSEERIRKISQGLRTVLEMADELILTPDLDTIYLRAVEFAREKLGVERCGLFIFDAKLENQLGTFGTDGNGNVTDERHITLSILNSTAQSLLDTGERLKIVFNGEQVYWDRTGQQQLVGFGWIACTIVRSSIQPLGIFYNDTAISHSPVNEIQQEILAIYCSLLGNIIERKHVEQHLLEQTTQIAALYELSRDIVSSLDLEQVYAAAHRAVASLMPTEAFFIALLDEEKQEIQDVYLIDQGQRWPNRITSLAERGMTAHVIQTGAPLQIDDDAQGIAQVRGTLRFGTSDLTRSILIAPLKLGGKVIGAISAQHYTPNVYTTEHVQILETLANQIAIAIEHARLVQSLRLQTIALDAAANAILISDRNGLIQWANPAFTTLTGYTLAEALGQKTSLVWSGQHDEAFYKRLWDTIQAGQIWHGEVTNRRKDGRLYIEEQMITPVRDENGEVFRFIAIKQDISERKKAEEREEHRQKLLEKVIELGKTVTQTTDLQDCLQQIHLSIQKGLGFDRVGLFLFNPQTNSLHGAYGTDRKGEIEDTSWFKRSVDDYDSWQKILHDPQGISVIENYHRVYTISSESPAHDLMQHVTVAAWAGETPVALIAVDNIITQRNITPEALEALQLFAGYAGLAIENTRWNAELGQRVADRTAELEAANQQLQAFTYTIAHDLRAPARAMIGFSGLLEENLTERIDLDSISQSYIARVHNAAKRMGQMIDELLEYTRLGRMPIYKQPVDMHALVKQVLAQLQEKPLDKQIEITLHEIPACEGDPKLLEQVWKHLLGNALKYTHPHLIILEIGSGKDEGEIPYYYVRDNGIGFDMQYVQKLFGVFQRLHIEDEFEGTGMGLALTERIIERHGGRIWAKADPNLGATFFFALGQT